MSCTVLPPPLSRHQFGFTLIFIGLLLCIGCIKPTKNFKKALEEALMDEGEGLLAEAKEHLVEKAKNKAGDQVGEIN